MTSLVYLQQTTYCSKMDIVKLFIKYTCSDIVYRIQLSELIVQRKCISKILHNAGELLYAGSGSLTDIILHKGTVIVLLPLFLAIYNTG